MVYRAKVVSIDPKTRSMRVNLDGAPNMEYTLPVPMLSYAGAGGVTVVPREGDTILVLEDDFNDLYPLPIVVSPMGVFGVSRPPTQPGEIYLTTKTTAITMKENWLYAFVGSPTTPDSMLSLQGDSQNAQVWLMSQKDFNITTKIFSLAVVAEPDGSSGYYVVSAKPHDETVYLFKIQPDGLYVSFKRQGNEFSLQITDHVELEYGQVNLNVTPSGVKATLGETEITLQPDYATLKTPKLSIEADVEINGSVEINGDIDVSSSRVGVTADAVSVRASSYLLDSDKASVRAQMLRLSTRVQLVGDVQMRGDLDVNGDIRQRGKDVALVPNVNRAFNRTFSALSNIVNQLNTHIHITPFGPTGTVAVPIALAAAPPKVG